jgi:hypothetical protein
MRLECSENEIRIIPQNDVEQVYLKLFPLAQQGEYPGDAEGRLERINARGLPFMVYTRISRR